MTTLLAIAVGLLALLWPEASWAWGPSTHLKFAHVVLQHLDLLPAWLADLLGRHPGPYYYGNIIADLILGKRYRIEPEQHSHNWRVALGLLERAETPPLRAAMWGYLTHLAADVVAHNLYVPIQLVRSAPGRGRGHFYWELHYDAYVPDHFARATAHVQRLGRHHTDHFLMRHLAETLFSHRTNRWIFRTQMLVQRLQAYRRLAQRTVERSPYRLPVSEVRRYDALALAAIGQLLRHGEAAPVLRHDPNGHAAIAYARRIRKTIRRSNGTRPNPGPAPVPGEVLAELAEPLAHLERSPIPWRSAPPIHRRHHRPGDLL